MPRRWAPVVCAALLLHALACASPRPRLDPLAPVNRAAFALDGVTWAVVDPLGSGLDVVLEGTPHRLIGNFFHNLSTPKLLLADLAQGRARDAGEDLLRFALNTTAGLAGLLDVATRVGLERHDEDLGQAFCRWGIPYGPYVYFPLLGPASALEAVSITLDTALAPVDSLLPYLARQSGRARLLREIEAAHVQAPGTGFYDFQRIAYQRNRVRQARDEPFLAPAAAHLRGDAPYGTCGYRDR